MVFLFRSVNARTEAALLGFGGGVMTASSFFSLLLPASEYAEQHGWQPSVPLCVGFLAGTLLVFLANLFLERRRTAMPRGDESRRTSLLVFAVTLHNIPEGLSVGVAFGAAGASAAAAFALAIGIAVQNFPEGAAVSLPLRREGTSKGKAFLLGSLSGATEPVAGCIGFLAASAVAALLPFSLSFAAGCMIAVALCEVLPDAVSRAPGPAFWGCTVGFSVMMLLDTFF